MKMRLISKALKSMSPMKAPGPDGFQLIFYQRTWIITDKSVVPFVKRLLRGESIPEGSADALHVLVPKINKPSNINQFRLISLCNVSYKITTNVIANRSS